jgi:CheY-like chemotaxis protein
MEAVIKFKPTIFESDHVVSSCFRQPGGPSLVLIAEDEAEIADILAAYLQRHGLRTLHAADGREALAMHQTCKPDLLLLDVQMRSSMAGRCSARSGPVATRR